MLNRMWRRIGWFLLLLTLCAGCSRKITALRLDPTWLEGRWSGWITPVDRGTADSRRLIITIRANRVVFFAIADTVFQTTNGQVRTSDDPATLSRSGVIDFDATVANQPLHFHGNVAECFTCFSGMFGYAANADSTVYEWWAGGPY